MALRDRVCMNPGVVKERAFAFSGSSLLIMNALVNQ
jgi:hypothetical protein